MVKQTRGYRVWDPSSEEALKAGVRKHGLGAWEHIRKDPQFAILSDRTGVQLKDKWRNLVKFRHIDPDEQRTYKPKTQGPWSKKYKRERSQGLSGTASPASGDGGASEDEGGHQEALQPQANGSGGGGGELALATSSGAAAEAAAAADVGVACPLPEQQLVPQAQRQSVRTSAQKRKAITDLALMLEGDGGDPYPGSEDDEGGAGGGEGEGGADGGGARRGSRHRSVGRSVPRSAAARHRKAHEDRRFGIYDRRRYGFAENGSGSRGRSFDGEGGLTCEDGHASDANGARAHGHGLAYGASGAAPQRVRRRNGPASRRGGGRGRSDDEDDEDDEEGLDQEGSDDPIDGEGGVGSGAGADDAEGAPGEEYVINCPCGVTFDDGEMMIECESCAAWAHVACLRHQMASQPEKYRYDFDTYHCAACQGVLQSLQYGSGCGGGGGSGVLRGRRGSALASPSAAVGSASAPGGGGSAGGFVRNGVRVRAEVDGEAGGRSDGDTASEDSQRKELSNILLGLANGRLGGGTRGSGRRGGQCSGDGKPGLFGRASAPASAGQQGGVGGSGGADGAGGAAGGCLKARSLSLGRTSSSGLGGTAAAAPAVGTITGGQGGALDGGSRTLLKPGPVGAPAEASCRPLMAGPASSTSSRGRLDGAASPPPVLDGSLPLFQTGPSASGGSGGGGGGATGVSTGTKIFKPIPKLATVPGLPEPVRQQQQQLSAPKARPHPALQQGASQSNLQRMLEAANPLSGPGGGGSARGMPLSSALEAAGPLQVVAANLCAATGRKAATAAASASTGGAAAASDGVGSCDAAATAGGLPPRPPSRPPSSMAREVANRIFGESDDDDPTGLGRPLSALRGATTDPWFLMPPSLSRAATPSAFLDTILRATPDIVPPPGTSPPPHLAAALAAVRCVSPGAAYLPALLAQQQQQQAVMQQFLAQAGVPPMVTGAAVLPPVQQPAQASSAAAAAAAAAGLILPPLLARPTPLAPPPPVFPAPLAIGGMPPGWPAGTPPLPPPPTAVHLPGNGNEPVTLHPVLRHLLLTTAQQQQPQQQRGADGAGAQAPPPTQQPQQQLLGGSAGGESGAAIVGGGGAEPTAVRIKEEATDAAPPPLSQHHPHHPQQPHANSSQQQQQQQPQRQSAEDRASNGGGGATGLAVALQPLVRSTPTLPLSQPSATVAAAGTLAQGPAALAAVAAVAAAAANGPGGSGSAAAGSAAPAVFDSSGPSTVATLLGLNVGGLNLNVLEQWRSASPDPWGFFRTSTPGPEAILQSFLHPPPSGDINSLPWIKSGTPPLSVAELMGGPPSAGVADLQPLDR